MRRWHVGTITLGLTLLIVGAGLIYARINGFSATDIIMQWWPLAFIALGLEVLAQYYINRKGEERMRYDLISMFLILLIIVSGLGLQILSETGLSERLHQEFYQELNSDNYTVSLPAQEIAVPAGIARIIINCDNNEMDIHTASVPSCIINGQTFVRATSQEEAAILARQQNQISTRIAGDILFIETDTKNYAQNVRSQSCNIIIPEGLPVEINGSAGSVTYTGSGTGSPLSITGDSAVKLILPATADVNILAYMSEQRSAPAGNLQWTPKTMENLVPSSPPANSSSDIVMKSDDGQVYYGEVQDNTAENNSNREKTTRTEYQTQLGNGTHAIRLFNNSSLEVFVQ